VVVSGLRPAEPLVVAAAVALFGIWLIEVGLVLGLVVERRTYEQAGPVAAMIVLLLPAVFFIRSRCSAASARSARLSCAGSTPS